MFKDLSAKVRRFLREHPLLRDALLWAIPALLAGLILRLLLLHYSPYAYYGSDSRSTMGFANGVLSEFYFSINEKRRYLYPVFLLFMSILPGGTMKWVAWIQPLLGLLTVLPLAYFVRRVFTTWQWLIIPVTVLYAAMPVLIWYEHESIGDTIIFDCIVWCMAGWAAWVSQTSLMRARRLWWCFFIPLALLLLTKPSGKFLWPGIIIALVVVGAWRILRWPHWVALILLFMTGLTVGQERQSSWLLYTTAFPLTVLESSLHAEYKREIKDLVIEKRERLNFYNNEDDEIHDFLRSPENHPEFPLWKKAAKNEQILNKVSKDLAFEAIKARPDLFLVIALQRLAGSANPDAFKTRRFESTYLATRFKEQYENGKNRRSMLQIAFGFPIDPNYLPPYETFQKMISPYPDSKAALWLREYADTYQAWGKLLHLPATQMNLLAIRPTFLGYWLALGVIASLFLPQLRVLGVWTITLGGYLVAVYLVGVEHHRYFALAWALILMLLALVPELLVCGIKRLRQGRVK